MAKGMVFANISGTSRRTQRRANVTEERDVESTNGHGHKYAPALQAVAHTAGEIKRLDRELIEKVRERPLVAVGVALGVGYVVGRLFSRWG